MTSLHQQTDKARGAVNLQRHKNGKARKYKGLRQEWAKGRLSAIDAVLKVRS